MAFDIISSAGAIQFADLGLSPIALDLGFFQLRWYSLAYMGGIFFAYLYLNHMVKRPHAPMAPRHIDDLFIYSIFGIILGGRLGYIIFYRPDLLLSPLEIIKVWEGGMSFHGGLLGTILAIYLLARKHDLHFLRMMDYIACAAPVGFLLGRLANFVNGELWGRTTSVEWGVIFPHAGNLPRHPSQLYEAGLEGAALFIILNLLFWMTKARLSPGLLTGVGLIGYGAARFFVEYFREPDRHLQSLVEQYGISMGQILTLPMILIGLYFIFTAPRRRKNTANNPEERNAV